VGTLQAAAEAAQRITARRESLFDDLVVGGIGDINIAAGVDRGPKWLAQGVVDGAFSPR
jgi:hypothetical protein